MLNIFKYSGTIHYALATRHLTIKGRSWECVGGDEEVKDGKRMMFDWIKDDKGVIHRISREKLVTALKQSK